MSCRRASVTAFELVARVDRHAFAGELNWCDVVVDEAARPAPFDTRLMPRAASDAAPSTNGANRLGNTRVAELKAFAVHDDPHKAHNPHDRQRHTRRTGDRGLIGCSDRQLRGARRLEVDGINRRLAVGACHDVELAAGVR